MSNNGPDPKETLRQSLSSRTPEELADICSELILSYVVKKQAPSVAQLGMIPVPGNLREMDFSQIVSWMKHNLTLPELEFMEVNDDGVSIRIGEQHYPIGVGRFTGTPEAPAQSAGPQPPAPAPTNSTPASSAAPTPEPSAAPQPRPQSNPPATPQTPEPEDDATLSERFSMLEID